MVRKRTTHENEIESLGETEDEEELEDEEEEVIVRKKKKPQNVVKVDAEEAMTLMEHHLVKAYQVLKILRGE